MNFRTFVSLAVVLLLVVNATLLVLGQSDNPPPCPHGGGTEGVPGWALCGAPDSYDCDNGSTWWDHAAGTQWLIQTSTAGDYIASYKGATWPVPGLLPPVFWWHSFEANMIDRTGAVCGGRRYTRLSHFFRPERSDNEDDFIMQDGNAPCYRIMDCDWCPIGTIYGWHWETVNAGTSSWQRAVLDTIINYSCELFEIGSPATDRIWVPCQEDDE